MTKFYAELTDLLMGALPKTVGVTGCENMTGLASADIHSIDTVLPGRILNILILNIIL